MKTRKIISLLLAAFTVGALLSGCTQGNGASNSSNNSPSEQAVEYTLIDNKTSDYVIVVPETCVGSEMAAAETLQMYLYSATSCKLDIVTENQITQEKPIINFGDTSFYRETQLNIDVNSLNYDGYVIKNIEEDIFISAGTGSAAYQYSSYEMLEKLINFQAFAVDEISFDSSFDVKYQAFDLVDIPAFRYRNMHNNTMKTTGDYTTNRKLLRENQNTYTTIGSSHNIYKYLPPETYNVGHETCSVGDEERCGKGHPEWYVNPELGLKGDVCWSNQELIDELILQVLKEVAKAPRGATHIMVGQNDGSVWCACNDCVQAKEKYGANSAVVVKAVNQVADAVAAWIKENAPDWDLKVTMFAYKNTLMAPVKKDVNGNLSPVDQDVVLRNNVAVRVAPIHSDFSKSFYDSVNSDNADSIKGWGVLAKEILIWNYNTNFRNYFIPFCSFNAVQDNYRFFAENNVSCVMEQGAHNSNQTGFIEYRNYLYTKLMWNPNEDVNALTEAFFDNYYREGSKWMQLYLKEYREWFNVISNKYGSAGGGVYDYFSDFDVFPLQVINRWEGYLNQAKEEISYLKDVDGALYAEIYDRIDKETLFFDWIRLDKYSTSYSSGELYEMRVAFKEKCLHFDIQRSQEGVLLSTYYTTWGI